MDILSIIIIGIGLAMDCFAVSISKGIHAKRYFFWLTFRMAFLFGLFQAIMPLIGYFAGAGFAEYVKSIDHWLAFGLLSLIGGKMIVEGFKPIDPDSDKTVNPFSWTSILSLSLATSIDAFATGIVFIPFPTVIWRAVAIIGLISFIFTFIGMFIGVHFGKRFHLKVEMFGGFILIGIGLKILIEHLINHY
ncbi:MAG: manganese efflux pump MntP family protein [Bacteroidota bacterium]|nr:manganese efflux pump MntP family protein [Bacteroidota bacterium]